MTVNEYITMDLILPLAGGLAGAALYHLLGPMLRGCIAAARFASFLCGWAIEAASQRENARAFAWDVVYGKRSPESNVAYERAVLVEETLYLKDAATKVRLDALEERMHNVEAKTLSLWADNLIADGIDRVRSHQAATGAAIQEESERVKMQAMYKQWFGDSPSAGAVAPYGAGFGKPCPKPTKDLRPGDEVSVKAFVTSVDTEHTYFKVASDKEFLSVNQQLHAEHVDFDRIRTDNK